MALRPFQPAVGLSGGSVFAAAVALAFSPAPAQADLLSPWRYIKDYHLGVDVGQTTDSAILGFSSKRGGKWPSLCTKEPTDKGRHDCQMGFSKSSEGYGIFLQQPFERQGFWHLDYDLGLGLRFVDGNLESTSPNSAKAPLEEIGVHLYSVVARPYLTVGVTPRDWPDLLVSLGPTGEAVWGSVDIGDKRHQTRARGVFRRSSVTSIFSYIEAELVFLRFGEGSAALSYWNLRGDGYVQDGQLLPGDLPNMSDPSLTLNKTFLGFKVLAK